jgi:hypothetical protein
MEKHIWAIEPSSGMDRLLRGYSKVTHVRFQMCLSSSSSLGSVDDRDPDDADEDEEEDKDTTGDQELGLASLFSK